MCEDKLNIMAEISLFEKDFTTLLNQSLLQVVYKRSLKLYLSCGSVALQQRALKQLQVQTFCFYAAKVVITPDNKRCRVKISPSSFFYYILFMQ